MNDMALVSPAMMGSMMAAMMLPSFAPTLWRYHRALGATRVPRAGGWTLVFALGYAVVWTMIASALYAVSDASVPSWAAGAVVLWAGVIQCTQWKAIRLVRCRDAFAPGCVMPCGPRTAFRDGWRFGIDCGLSCAAPTAILFVVGLMDVRAMAAITLVITAERLAPMGTRIARVTGAVAFCAGLIMCLRAS
jgi:predicted metal-binding membrane protein